MHPRKLKFSQRQIKIALCAVAILGILPAAGAMHIMEGFLPVGWCVAWGALCLPFLYMGYRSIKRTVENNPRAVMYLAMAGAFIFVISAIKMPSVDGSSSHATGTGLGAILFGPASVCLLALIVLLFQALLLGHGGLSTLGANVFSMGIAGPFIGFGIYKLCDKLGAPKVVSVFIGAFFADLSTYIITSFQLAAAHPGEDFFAQLAKFLGIFAVTQLPLAASEALLTVLIYKGLQVLGKGEIDALRAPIASKAEGKTVPKAGRLGVRITYSVIAALFAAGLVFGLSHIDIDGTDDLAGEAVLEGSPDYEPIAENLIDLEDYEVPLFCVQAGLGAAIVTFCFVTIADRVRRPKLANGSN